MSQKRYCIVWQLDMVRLEDVVNRKIEDGWLPVGGVSLVVKYYASSDAWCQAMYKPL